MDDDEEKVQLPECILKIINDARTCKMCLNCKFSYITEETGFGFCYYDGPGRPETLFVKPITETHVCEHWKKHLTKRNDFNL